MRGKTGKRMAAALLCSLLASLCFAGCNGSGQVSGTLYMESLQPASQTASPQPPSQAPAPGAQAYDAAVLPSGVSAVRRSLVQALKATNEQKNFQRTATRSLLVGEVEMVSTHESLQSADGEKTPVQLQTVEAAYRTETASSLGWEDRVTYLENGLLYSQETLEDSLNAANNRTAAVKGPVDSAQPVLPVPDFYVTLTDGMISNVDISQNGADILYSFTLDPEKTRDKVAALLQEAPYRLEIDPSALGVDYNVCTARSNAEGFVTELSSSIGIRYALDGEELAGELNVDYAFDQFGTTPTPEMPDWAADIS